MEFSLFENKDNKIIGYQIGQNLNSLGTSENAYIVDTTYFSKKLTVTTNVEGRKIVYYPHSTMQIKTKDNTISSQDQFEILFTDGYKTTKNIIINILTGENHTQSK
jgi:hypothetical protein